MRQRVAPSLTLIRPCTRPPKPSRLPTRPARAPHGPKRHGAQSGEADHPFRVEATGAEQAERLARSRADRCGRYVMVRCVRPDALAKVSAFADDGNQWIFDEAVLILDGWTEHDGRWRPPKRSACLRRPPPP